MIRETPTATFIVLHVVVSLVAVVAGGVAIAETLARLPSGGWNTGSFATTIATSVNGFASPPAQFGLPHAIGVISLIVLSVALFALYGRRLAGPWRVTYAASAVLAFYLCAFVSDVQAFQKLGPLKAIAPTQSEPSFLAVQIRVLEVFLAFGHLSVKRARGK